MAVLQGGARRGAWEDAVATTHSGSDHEKRRQFLAAKFGELHKCRCRRLGQLQGGSQGVSGETRRGSSTPVATALRWPTQPYHPPTLPQKALLFRRLCAAQRDTEAPQKFCHWCRTSAKWAIANKICQTQIYYQVWLKTALYLSRKQVPCVSSLKITCGNPTIVTSV